VIAGLDRGVIGMGAGESRRIDVEPEEGYGPLDPDMIRELPRESFPPELELRVGQAFTGRGAEGPVTFRVRSFDDETVWADFSHPLAGERLHFDVTLLEVRAPQPGEPSPPAACAPTDCSACGEGCGG
jgi:FKBP-type peptidyl-prolyl cis-trans isomerase SlyD